jgi:hypothetical protein
MLRAARHQWKSFKSPNLVKRSGLSWLRPKPPINTDRQKCQLADDDALATPRRLNKGPVNRGHGFALGRAIIGRGL